MSDPLDTGESSGGGDDIGPNPPQHDGDAPLSNADIARFSRHLLVPDIGVKGQQRLLQARVAVVGAGGLGSPLVMYLAAAGIGHLTIFDGDHVEVSNLQRQIAHSEASIGVNKAVSAASAAKSLRAATNTEAVPDHVTAANALQVLAGYDVLVDATDNVATRYLLSDAAAALDTPLVSASALRMEGQLTVYHASLEDDKAADEEVIGWTPTHGPCFRCLHPVPPPAASVSNCSDGGVLGVVPGIMGSIQALEVIKILAGLGSSYVGKMLLFNARTGSFRTVRLRGQQQTCAACGEGTSTAPVSLVDDDYELFCGMRASDAALTEDPLRDAGVGDDRNLSPTELMDRAATTDVVLLDVRVPLQFDICALPGSINIPLSVLQRSSDPVATLADAGIDIVNSEADIVCVCRRGVDSIVALQLLCQTSSGLVDPTKVWNLRGGLVAWSAVNPDFPVY